MLLAVLSTVCVLATVVCGLCVWRATTQGDRAEHAANRLLRTQGAIKALEGSVEELEGRWRRVNGRLGQVERVIHDAIDEAEDDDPRPDNAPPSITAAQLGVCENWQRAQDEGPRSESAKCACDYCNAKREERRRQRLAAVPSTVQGQAALAKLNAGKP